MSTGRTWGAASAQTGPPRGPAMLRYQPDSIRARWKEPDKPHRWVIIAAAGAGLVAAVVIPGAPRLGINLLICALAVAIPVLILGRQQGRRRGRSRPVGLVASAFGLLAVGLSTVAAVRSSEWLTVGCAMAGFCLGAAGVLGVRRWNAVLLSVPLFSTATLRALPWVARSVRVVNLRSRSLPWLNGFGLGLLLTLIVGALLASADAAFAAALQTVSSAFRIDLLIVRVFSFLVAAGIVLGAAFAVSTKLNWPPPLPSSPSPSPAEWLTPLVLVAGTIAAFLAVEATQLFGGADLVLRESALTHADRARAGFGQLTAVTLIVLGLTSWAGVRAAGGPARNRRLMTATGGVLLTLTLLLAASALRRLWLYQQAYGWTVTRLNVGAFELWLTVVLLGAGLAWLLRRTELLPSFVIGSAGLGLLIVALAGPDAIVANGNVTRFERTGKIDVPYLSGLSADAVPALNRLPEPQRSCALAFQSLDRDPWFGWNLSRYRAAQLLHRHPVTPVNLRPACPEAASSFD